MKSLFLIPLVCLIFSNVSLFAQPIIKVVDTDKILNYTKEKQYLDSIYCWGYDTLNFRANYLYYKFYEIGNELILRVKTDFISPKLWNIRNKQYLEYQREVFKTYQFAQDAFSIKILQLENEIREKVIPPILTEYANTHQIGFIIDIEHLHYYEKTEDITNEIIIILQKESLNPYIDRLWHFKIQTLIKDVKKRLKFDISPVIEWN